MDVLLHHPLTSSMVVGRQQLLRSKQHLGQQLPPDSEQATGGGTAQSSAAAAGSQQQQHPVGLPPAQLGVVDAGLLGLFLALPYRLQLLLLDSSMQQLAGGLADGADSSTRWGAASSRSPGAMLLQDGLRCRLQQLVPSFQL